LAVRYSRSAASTSSRRSRSLASEPNASLSRSARDDRRPTERLRAERIGFWRGRCR